jgi:hypothetical protein
MSPDGRHAAGVGLVGGRVALLLGGELQPTLLRAFKDAVFARDPVESVFRVLSDGGIRNLPSFACVIRDDAGVRLLLRGSVAADVRTFKGEDRTIRGEAVSTWAEHVIRDPREVTLHSTARNLSESTLVLLFEERDQARRSTRNRRPPEQAPAVVEAPIPTRERPPASAPDRSTPAPPRPAPQVVRAEDPTVNPAAEPVVERAPAGRARTESEGEFDFAHLLDQTQFKGVEAAAVREPLIDEPSVDARWNAVDGLIYSTPATRPPPPTRPPAPVSPSAPVRPGDHGGDTVSVPRVSRPPASRGTAEHWLRPVVQAVRCVQGHANPPNADVCLACGGPIGDRSVFRVERPVLGRLRFADGLVVDLDRPLVLGRRPDQAASEKIGGEEPGFVALPDPQRSLSRVHAEVRIEEWHVMVVDRKSANGTVVVLPGEEARQLHPNQPCLITFGTEVMLADVASFVFEMAPG